MTTVREQQRSRIADAIAGRTGEAGRYIDLTDRAQIDDLADLLLTVYMGELTRHRDIDAALDRVRNLVGPGRLDDKVTCRQVFDALYLQART